MRCASNIVFLNADCLICRKQFGDAEMRFETRRELAERPLISEICSQFPHPFSIQSSGEKWIENVQHLERNSQKENNFYKLAEALQIMWNEVDKVFKATITVFWAKRWQDQRQGVVSGGRVAEVVREHGWHPPKILDSDGNFKPEHTLFCRELRFVAIYALFGDLWAKKVPFWVKNSVSWARSALLHGIYCIFYWVKFANLQ